MTANMIETVDEASGPPQFPDFPPRYDMRPSRYLHQHGVVAYLQYYFRRTGQSALVMSATPVTPSLSGKEDFRIPDLSVAFGCDYDLLWTQWGYEITRQGKALEFALELAPPEKKPPGEAFELPPHPLGPVNFAKNRLDYERFGALEYWQLDPDGVERSDAPLVGERLVNGRYEQIAVESVEGVGLRGFSEALGLYVCWEDDSLRFYDPVAKAYLLTHQEEADRGKAAEVRVNAALRQLAEFEEGDLAKATKLSEVPFTKGGYLRSHDEEAEYADEVEAIATELEAEVRLKSAAYRMAGL